MFDWILKRVLPLPKLEQLESYLFIGPHPDDIEVACAPTVKKLTGAGRHVRFLIVTDGRMGTADPELWGERLAAVRRGEAAASAKLLGVTDVAYLPFEDAGNYTADACAREIAVQIALLKPDAVFAPDPDVIAEFHADHIKAGQAVKYASCMAPFPSVMEALGCAQAHSPKVYAFYNTDRPNSFIRVGKTFAFREKALACHGSQFDGKAVHGITLYYRLRSIRLGLFRRFGLCDGYRAVTPARSHCFPESARW
jgi:LmbE family N-acetylglucosaminyl deacetylase